MCHNSVKYLLYNTVTEKPQKQYQAFYVNMDEIRQIARQNMPYSFKNAKQAEKNLKVQAQRRRVF